MVPTVEEYRDFLMMKKANPDKIFLPKRERFRTLTTMMGIDTKDIREYMDGDYFQVGYLEQFVDENSASQKGRDILAFLIYGMVIFPNSQGHIHLSVVALFSKIQHEIDPSAAILAETIRSLNSCRKVSGEFEACAQMLTLWFKSHFGYKKNVGMSFNNDDKVPIAIYNENEWLPGKDERTWIEWFRNLDDSYITWIARWMRAIDIPYIDAKIPWVPLVGIWGTTNYSLLLVKRQYGSEQFIPLTSYLIALDIPHDTNDQMEEAKLWGVLFKEACRMERSAYIKKVISEYLAWYRKRVTEAVNPTASEYLTIERPIDEVKRLKIENQRLRERIEITELT